MAPVLDKLVFKDILLLSKIDAVANELVEVSNGYDDFKKPVEDVKKTLMNMKVLLEKRAEIGKQIDSSRNKIENYKKAFGQPEKDIRTYCTSG